MSFEPPLEERKKEKIVSIEHEFLEKKASRQSWEPSKQLRDAAYERAQTAQLAICAVLAQSISSNMMIWPLVFAWGAAAGGMYTAGLSGLGAKFEAGDLPTASTGFIMVWEVGALLGPVIAGAAMQVWDPHGLAAVLAVLGTLLLLASLRSRRVVTTG